MSHAARKFITRMPYRFEILRQTPRRDNNTKKGMELTNIEVLISISSARHCTGLGKASYLNSNKVQQVTYVIFHLCLCRTVQYEYTLPTYYCFLVYKYRCCTVLISYYL